MKIAKRIVLEQFTQILLAGGWEWVMCQYPETLSKDYLGEGLPFLHKAQGGTPQVGAVPPQLTQATGRESGGVAQKNSATWAQQGWGADQE